MSSPEQVMRSHFFMPYFSYLFLWGKTMRAITAALVLAAVTFGSACLAQNSDPVGAVQSDQVSVDAVLANLRAHADRPFTDQEVSELRSNDDWKYIRKYKRVCDGSEESDDKGPFTPYELPGQTGGCWQVAGYLKSAKDGPGSAAYFWKACQLGLAAGFGNGASPCRSASAVSELSIAVRREMLLRCQATSCLYALAISFCGQECGDLYDDKPKDIAAAAQYAKQGCEEATPEVSGSIIASSCKLAQRLGSVQDISSGLAAAQQQTENYHQQNADYNAAIERRNQQLDQQMANNAAMVNDVTHNGNLIAETANRQTSAILAIGGAGQSRVAMSAPRSALSVQQRSPVSVSSQNSIQVASSNAGSNGSSTAADQYVSPINGCVSEFWDSSQYGWLSFQNNCGRAIHLGFVAQNGTGAFGGSGGSADIPESGSKNIGQNQAEVSAAGNYFLFICPAGYIAVSANGTSLSATNTSFRCKKW